jgi:hypothetical protein
MMKPGLICALVNAQKSFDYKILDRKKIYRVA